MSWRRMVGSVGKRASGSRDDPMWRVNAAPFHASHAEIAIAAARRSRGVPRASSAGRLAEAPAPCPRRAAGPEASAGPVCHARSATAATPHAAPASAGYK